MSAQSALLRSKDKPGRRCSFSNGTAGRGVSYLTSRLVGISTSGMALIFTARAHSSNGRHLTYGRASAFS